jgi:hypothetical protein
MAKQPGRVLYLVQTVRWEPELDEEWEPRADRFHCPDPTAEAP